MNRLLIVLVLASLPGYASPAPVPAAKVDVKTELARLSGAWEVTSYVKGGEEMVGKMKKLVITFKADGSYAVTDNSTGEIVSIDPAKAPKEIDYVQVDGGGNAVTDVDGNPLIEKGIYKLEGDTFSDCFTPAGKARPTEFKSTQQNGWTVAVYKRVKKID